MNRRSPQSIGSLGLALCRRWEPERLFVITTVYIDESGTHGPAPHMTIGGWVGRWGQWDSFDPKWKGLLKDSGLTFFHSKEMKHEENEFAGWTDAKKLKFMHAAADIAEKHTLFGFTFVLQKEDYQRFYKAEHTSQDLPLDSQYGICFRACLSVVPYLVVDALPKQKNLDLHFVLESGHPNYGDAARIFDLAKKSGPPEVANILRTITAGDKKDFPGLQAADANAYTAFLHEGNQEIAPIKIPGTEIWKEAKKISKSPVFRCSVGEETLSQFKGHLLSRYALRLANRATKKAAP